MSSISSSQYGIQYFSILAIFNYSTGITFGLPSTTPITSRVHSLFTHIPLGLSNILSTIGSCHPNRYIFSIGFHLFVHFWRRRFRKMAWYRSSLCRWHFLHRYVTSC